MKKLFIHFIPVIVMLMISTMNVHANQAMAEVDSITASDSSEAYRGGIITDQTGEFISIYLTGKNLNMNTVKPVFYDEYGNPITSEVAASEQTDEGAYFRLKKLDSESWNLKDVPGGKKQYTVELEPIGNGEVQDNRINKMVEIGRRDIYFHYGNTNSSKVIIYLADDLNISEKALPVLKFKLQGGETTSIKKVNGKIEKNVNPLTGTLETKAVFTVSRQYLEKDYMLSIDDGNGEMIEILNKLGPLLLEDREVRTTLEGGSEYVFYLPYWIGGAYVLQAEVAPEKKEVSEYYDYYITEENISKLGEQVYSVLRFPEKVTSKEDTAYSGTRVRFSYHYWAVPDTPEKPEGKPEATVKKVDKNNVKLSWTAVKDASQYYICVKKLDENKIHLVGSTSKLTYVCDISNFDYIYGDVEGDFYFCILPYAEKGEYKVFGERSDFVKHGTPAAFKNIQVKGYDGNYDGKSHSITLSGVPDGAKVTYKTSKNGKYSSTKPKRTNVGVTKVYYKVTKTGYKTLTGTEKIIVRPKAPSKVTTSLTKYNAVKVKWNKVTGASGYYVYYKKTSAEKYTYYKRTTSLYTTKESLASGTEYIFKIVPYVKSGDVRYMSESFATSSIRTLKKVSTLSVAEQSSSKVRVEWQDIEGESGYQISKSTSSSKTNIVATFKTPETLYKDISAKRGTTYYYKVRAYKTVGEKKIYGPWSGVKKYRL